MENYLPSIFLPTGCLGSVLSAIHVLAYFLPLPVRAHTHTYQPYTVGAIIIISILQISGGTERLSDLPQATQLRSK